MSGFKGPKNPKDVANPSRPARPGAKSPFVHSRRYLDWNRQTFMYNTKQTEKTFDQPFGLNVTSEITKVREELKDMAARLRRGASPASPMTTHLISNPESLFPLLLQLLSTRRASTSPVLLSAIREVSASTFIKGHLHTTTASSFLFTVTSSSAFLMCPMPWPRLFCQSELNFAEVVALKIWLCLPNVLLTPFRLNKPSLSTRDDNLATMPIPRDSCTDPLWVI